MIATIYKTNDGKEFDTFEDAMIHDAELRNGFQMYNRKGELVDEVDQAYIVHIDYEDTDDDTIPAAKAFIEMAEKQNSDYEGIEADCSGWFFWDEWDEAYRWLDDDIVTAFAKING